MAQLNSILPERNSSRSRVRLQVVLVFPYQELNKH